MTRQVHELTVEVLTVYNIHQFQGEAILTHRDPNFVVALLLKGSKHSYTAKDSDVSFYVHDVAFFAIHSIIKLFLEPDIVGNTYKLSFQEEIINETKRCSLRLSELMD